MAVINKVAAVRVPCTNLMTVMCAVLPLSYSVFLFLPCISFWFGKVASPIFQKHACLSFRALSKLVKVEDVCLCIFISLKEKFLAP